MSQINYKLLQSIIDIQYRLFEVQNHEITANYPTYEEVKSAIFNNEIDFNSKTHFVLKQQSKKDSAICIIKIVSSIFFAYI